MIWLANFSYPRPYKKFQAILKIIFGELIVQNLTKLYVVGKKLNKPKRQEKSKDDRIKNIRNPFEMKQGNKAFKDKTNGDIRNLFELKNENYDKPIRTGSFYNNNHIQYESTGDKDKNLSIDLNKLKPHLKETIDDLEKSDTWNIQLIIIINFISTKYYRERTSNAFKNW